MFLKKFITNEEPNIVIIKAFNFHPRLLTLTKRIYKVFKSYQPHHWFDGFMDGVEIELKELK